MTEIGIERGDVVAVLDFEFPERVFAAEEVALIREEAERLAGSLLDYAS